MKFFNIDLHISVIEDIKSFLEEKGHTVETICMSGHSWVFDKHFKETKVINKKNWKQIDQEMCDRFYEEYKDELKSVDVFISIYPPAFALLYERFNKPIICVAATRFDFPCCGHDRYNWLKQGLTRLYNNDQLIPITNNLYDRAYCEEYTDFEWTYVPSLCRYFKPKYDPQKNVFLEWSQGKFSFNDHRIAKKPKRYNWEDLIKYKGIVHIPYNVSIMSLFEHYWANIPLFCPTVDYMKSLSNKGILGQLQFPDSELRLKPEWLYLNDWYNEDNMPHIIRYDTNLIKLLKNTNLDKVSKDMAEFNLIREATISNTWNTLIDNCCHQFF